MTASIAGREVISSGTLSLAGGDNWVDVRIEDLTYRFVFVYGAAPPTCTIVVDDNKVATLTIAGSMPQLSQWWYPHVGTLGLRKISLSFVVSSFSGLTDRPAGFLLQYTFTADIGQSYLNYVGPGQ